LNLPALTGFPTLSARATDITGYHRTVIALTPERHRAGMILF